MLTVSLEELAELCRTGSARTSAHQTVTLGSESKLGEGTAGPEHAGKRCVCPLRFLNTRVHTCV